jgi:hypothetical protein
MLHMGCNVGVGAWDEEDMHGEQPLRGEQLERLVAGPVPQTLLLSTLLPYFPISIKMNKVGRERF